MTPGVFSREEVRTQWGLAEGVGVTGLRSRCQDIQVWVSAGKPKRIETHLDVKVTHSL